MAKSNRDEIKAGITKLSTEQIEKLAREAPAAEWGGRNLSDENVQAELIEKAYIAGLDELTFDEWVQMKLPTMDKRE